MMHIDNVDHVWKNGITKITSPNSNPNYRAIGDNSLISNRNLFFIPNGNTLGNYIPFYFHQRMPMLYVIQRGFNGVTATPAENIVYCITSVALVIQHEIDYLFTDGHAVDKFSAFYESRDISKIDKILDFVAIRDSFWKDENDLDKKRRKEAEFLLSDDLPQSGIGIFAVYNNTAKDRLLSFGIPNEKIIIKSEYYF